MVGRSRRHDRGFSAPLLASRTRRCFMRNWVLPEYIEDILPPEARAIESPARAAAGTVPRAWLRARHAAAARVPRVAADRHRPRHGPAHVQAGGPAVRAHHGRARRHHAAGGAHRCASAQPRGRDPALLLRLGAAYPAGGAHLHARAAADRRRDLRPRRYRRRPGNTASARASAEADRAARRAPRYRSCGGVSRAGAARRRWSRIGGRFVRCAAGQGCPGLAAH